MRKLGLTLLTVLIALQGLGQYTPEGIENYKDAQNINHEEIEDGVKVISRHGPVFRYTGRDVHGINIKDVIEETKRLLEENGEYFDDPHNERTNFLEGYRDEEDLYDDFAVTMVRTGEMGMIRHWILYENTEEEFTLEFILLKEEVSVSIIRTDK